MESHSCQQSACDGGGHRKPVEGGIIPVDESHEARHRVPGHTGSGSVSHAGAPVPHQEKASDASAIFFLARSSFFLATFCASASRSPTRGLPSSGGSLRNSASRSSARRRRSAWRAARRRRSSRRAARTASRCRRWARRAARTAAALQQEPCQHLRRLAPEDDDGGGWARLTLEPWNTQCRRGCGGPGVKARWTEDVVLREPRCIRTAMGDGSFQTGKKHISWLGRLAVSSLQGY